MNNDDMKLILLLLTPIALVILGLILVMWATKPKPMEKKKTFYNSAAPLDDTDFNILNQAAQQGCIDGARILENPEPPSHHHHDTPTDSGHHHSCASHDSGSSHSCSSHSCGHSCGGH